MQKMMERSEESENRKDKLLQRGFAVGNQLAVNPWLGFVLLWSRKGEWGNMIDGGSRYGGRGVGESLRVQLKDSFIARGNALYNKFVVKIYVCT